MTILQNTTNAVLPIFLLILCGYVTCAAGGIKREDVGRINRLNFNVFIPALIIYNIHNTKLSTAFRPGLIAYAVLGLLTEACLGWIIARYMVEKREQKGVVIQGLFRTNVTLIGVQLLANLIPNADLGPISIMSAFTVITINTVSVIALETYSGRKTGGKQLLASIVKNPLIIGCLMGVLLLVSDVKLPAAAETTLRDLSRLASPLSLFLLGAFFRFKDLRQDLKLLTAVTALRLVAFPAVFLFLAAALGFRGIYFATLIPVFATPTAAPSFAMAQRMGGDAELAGNIVVMTSLFCPLTIFAWCFLFQVLGLF